MDGNAHGERGCGRQAERKHPANVMPFAAVMPATTRDAPALPPSSPTAFPTPAHALVV
jgi:hypothetical protein